jgi:hypothetical protein
MTPGTTTPRRRGADLVASWRPGTLPGLRTGATASAGSDRYSTTVFTPLIRPRLGAGKVPMSDHIQLQPCSPLVPWLLGKEREDKDKAVTLEQIVSVLQDARVALGGFPENRCASASFKSVTVLLARLAPDQPG